MTLPRGRSIPHSLGAGKSSKTAQNASGNKKKKKKSSPSLDCGKTLGQWGGVVGPRKDESVSRWVLKKKIFIFKGGGRVQASAVRGLLGRGSLRGKKKKVRTDHSSDGGGERGRKPINVLHQG